MLTHELCNVLLIFKSCIFPGSFHQDWKGDIKLCQMLEQCSTVLRYLYNLNTISSCWAEQHWTLVIVKPREPSHVSRGNTKTRVTSLVSVTVSRLLIGHEISILHYNWQRDWCLDPNETRVILIRHWDLAAGHQGHGQVRGLLIGQVW